MQITINGKARAVRPGLTVTELVEELELRPQEVAVELNQSLVNRAKRDATVLAEGDSLELVTLVGGG
ncbi:MAG: sulfur carrier protein ThiS [bacterium]|jgi:thiamine biosynthesis protein ThiS|nr:sulfur carrier protein ThiS [Planctomycetota bacterium]HIL51228.1 sulfur carrier protein ThiS [Planctomycetota bacterium]